MVFQSLSNGRRRAECDPMNSSLRLDGLLFTHDESLLSVMTEVLDNFAIQKEVYSQASSALQILAQRRLDTVIVDWDEPQSASRLVRCARNSPPNSTATIVAVVDKGSDTHALLVGANFMIHKPANVEHATRCMRAAYGTILQNRRRAARVPVDIPVQAKIIGLGEIAARISDLSIGGMALHCNQPVLKDREVSAQLPLPGTPNSIHVVGQIVNVDSLRRAGIRFSSIPEKDLEILETWLATELAKLEQAEIPSDR